MRPIIIIYLFFLTTVVSVRSQLYPSLCELAHVLSVDGPVRQKLESLTGELAKAADKELQVRFRFRFLERFGSTDSVCINEWIDE